MTRAQTDDAIFFGLVGWCILLIAILFLSGCAGAKSPVRFHAHNVTGIVVNFDKCKMQDDGNFLCNGVIFKVNAIDVSTPPVR